MDYTADIGLEVHAEMLTRSKMFCGCAVVDTTQAKPNTSVCPICEGLPGTLPVVNQRAVEYALKVALALDCEIQLVSIFARKNYFYPDLPKGYQISQYEQPLALNGRLVVDTSTGEKTIRIRRVHLEEDTGKLTHVTRGKKSYSLIDLNRAGIALLEIVTEPDMHSAEDAGAYARQLRAIVRTLGVNTGDMEKGVIRFEANISVRSGGSPDLGTKVEIKNLNSFKAMEKAIDFEIKRQIARLEGGELVLQETVGWEDLAGVTFTQRSKEEAHDYRYFPEPDLPPLVVNQERVEEIRAALPELPRPRILRFMKEYGLSREDASVLVDESSIADYFEQTVKTAKGIPAKMTANWILGELFAWMKQSGESIENIRVQSRELARLLAHVQNGEINQATGKLVLTEMLKTGQAADTIIAAKDLQQVSDGGLIAGLVKTILEKNPSEFAAYKAGKTSLENWFFGQVMKEAGGKANPKVVREELRKQLGSG